VTTSCCRPASPDAAHEREGRVQQGRDSREVSAADLQHCDWCGAGTLTMLKCVAPVSCQPRAHAGTDCDRQDSNLAGNLGARRRAREFRGRFGTVCTGRLCACAPPDLSLALCHEKDASRRRWACECCRTGEQEKDGAEELCSVTKKRQNSCPHPHPLSRPRSRRSQRLRSRHC
jgi:hypothetical protein